MKVRNQLFDVVIIGSGLGGLQCAYILASEGYKVGVLEQNVQIGGNLQVFSRQKTLFDTGVHYIGGLTQGQNLHQYFKYFGIMDKLKLKLLDVQGFDCINFNGKQYFHAQGYKNFQDRLITYFPDEKYAIQKYCEDLQFYCDKFPLYHLNYSLSESYIYEDKYLRTNAYDYFQELTDNETLRNVLAGTNLLYAGIRENTPFYIHALVINSYLESAYRCVLGGANIAKYLVQGVKRHGGEIYTRQKVVGADLEGNQIKCVHTQDGTRVYAKHFISNAHPAATISIIGEENFRKAYVNRIKHAKNTISSFTLHLALKPNSFPYINYNIYHYLTDNVWDGALFDRATWPNGFMVCTPFNDKKPKYADGMSVMACMPFEEVAQWADSINTTAQPAPRSSDYEQYKREKEQILLDKLIGIFPDIRSKIRGIYSSTPLTYRDYIGNLDGSMYGIIKDSQHPARSFIHPKTKIPNLYFTGQNLNVHGILGVTISAFVTCFEFVDRERLMQKVVTA